MSSRFGFRKTYHGSSDTVVMSTEPRAIDKGHEELVPRRLLNRRARLQRRQLATLRIDTKLKSSSVVDRSAESPESPQSPGSPDSPDTPSIPVPTVGSDPRLSQGSTLGAAEGPSPVSPAFPASPSGIESPVSTTVPSFPPASTSSTAIETTTAITAAPPPPPPPLTLLTSTSLAVSTTSSSTTLSSSLQTSILSTRSSILSSTTENVGVPTSLVPLITATAKSTASKASSSSSPSTSSTSSTESTKITDGVTLDTTIAAPVVTTGPTTTAAALSAIAPTDDPTGLVQKGINSESGNLGVHIIFPVVFSVGVIAAIVAILWLKGRRLKRTSTGDQASLSNEAAPMGQQQMPAPGQRQSLRFRSDGSVMADLMDAAYAAENGGQYRQTQLSTPEGHTAIKDEKTYRPMDDPPMLSLPRRSGNRVFSWLGGLRSGAPTVRGSIAPPRSEASSADRTTVTGWPQGFEPADPQANPLPARTRCLSYWSESSQGVTPSVVSAPPVPAIPSAMFEPRVAQQSSQPASADVRPLQHPPSPTQTAITYNTAAMTESSWNTWGVEQHPRGDHVTGKKELWWKIKNTMFGDR